MESSTITSSYQLYRVALPKSKLLSSTLAMMSLVWHLSHWVPFPGKQAGRRPIVTQTRRGLGGEKCPRGSRHGYVRARRARPEGPLCAGVFRGGVPPRRGWCGN